MSYLDEIPTLDIANIPGYLNHVTFNMIFTVPKFDGDPSFAIDHVARFATYTSKVDVVHQDVLIMLFKRALQGHDSWLYNCKPRSMSSIEALFDKFLEHS